MGLINYSSIEDGTTIDASDVNTPLTTIYNDYNGNIDSNNLAANAVTTAKITDANVTTAKIADGAVTNAKLDATAGEVGGVWKAYTPTLTATITNPTLGSSTVTGRYTQVGKTVICHVLYTIVTGGAFNAGSGLYRFSLPVAANTTAPAAYDGIGVIFDSGTEFMVAIAKMASTGTQVELSKAKDGLNLSNNTPIATWANGDYVRFTITYEAA